MTGAVVDGVVRVMVAGLPATRPVMMMLCTPPTPSTAARTAP
jgi:hypothetical protein